MSKYIGARYVVKIYENSLDPSSTAWEAGVNYEPITLVTFNNGSYLSKKEVPSSVGDPATNPDYWAQTGFYNGQIAALTNRVDTLETEALEIPKKDYIAIGDVEFTRYHESGFVVDVIKVPYLKQDGVSKNIPTIVGVNSPQLMRSYAEGKKAAINGGFCDGSTLQTYGDVLVNDTVYSGDNALSAGDHILAINDDGDIEVFDYTTVVSTLPSLGYHFAMPCFDKIIENGSELATSDVTRFMQQLFGVDLDHNYYFITTSYNCDLTKAQQCSWIITHIPTIVDVVAIDSGGSTQTMVSGVRTNMDGDIKSDGEGRRIACSLCFNADVNESDIISILDMFSLVQNNNEPKLLYHIGSTEASIGTNIEAYDLAAYKCGNIVTLQAGLIFKAGYDGSWTTISALADVLPKPITDVWASCGPEITGSGAAKLSIQNDGHQTTLKPTVRLRAAAAASDTMYYINITYITRQNI